MLQVTSLVNHHYAAASDACQHSSNVCTSIAHLPGFIDGLQAAWRLADAEDVNKPMSFFRSTLNLPHMVKHPGTTCARLDLDGFMA